MGSAPLGAYGANERTSARQNLVATAVPGATALSSVRQLKGGSLVVVWNQCVANRSDWYGQLLDRSGQIVSERFSLGSDINEEHYRSRPAIDALPGGGFASIFYLEGSNRYLVQHCSAGGRLLVASAISSASAGREASIAALADGSYVAVWNHLPESHGTGFPIMAQRYSVLGASLDGPIQISTRVALHGRPAVAALENGGFVIVWSTQEDGTLANIYARQYDLKGQPASEVFQVNAVRAGRQHSPKVARLASGAYAIVWQSQDERFQSGLWTLRCKLFDATGRKIGRECLVSSDDRANGQDITALQDGGFVIAWESSSGGIHGRYFAATGYAEGPEFCISDTAACGQHSPSVAALDGGGFAVTWTSYREVFVKTYGAADASRGPQRRSKRASRPSPSWRVRRGLLLGCRRRLMEKSASLCANVS